MGLYKRGDVWWVCFSYMGEFCRRSTETGNQKEAQSIWDITKGELRQGKMPSIYLKVTFDELAEDFLTDYRINRRDTLNKAQKSVKHLGNSFAGMKASYITTDKVKAYIERRMNEGLSNASINRELAALKRMFHLGIQNTPPKVAFIPYIPMLKESNVREGFFERWEYEAVKDALPDYLKPVITFGYHSGWRISEILTLSWDNIDIREGIARLDSFKAKNEKGRTFYMNEELLEEMKALFRNRNLGSKLVFNRDGLPIEGFRKAWRTACIKAGLFEVLKDSNRKTVIVKDKRGNEKTIKVPTRIFHDFRRTAIRDMVRSGISEKVAMTISGHKTRSVFERYNIVNEEDLKEAARKKQAYHEQARAQVIPFRQAK